MAQDFFIKIDGIKGESQDSKHKDEIQLMSFSLGATQSGTFAHGTGGGAGKVNFQDIHFVMGMNKASALLLQSCATGAHIKEALITARKAGGTQVEYLKIKLTDILVSSYQSGGSAAQDGQLTDHFSLNFAKINFEYAPQDSKGALLPGTVASYDLKAQVK